MSILSVAALALLVAACDATGPTKSGAVLSPTAPTRLDIRIPIDLGSGGTGGQPGIDQGPCDDDPATSAPPCPTPQLQPQPVTGLMTITAADGSTLTGTFTTVTDAAGFQSRIGNVISGAITGTGRFADATKSIWLVVLDGQTVQFSLQWMLLNSGGPRTYGDEGTFSYTSNSTTDITCVSGQRVTISFTGNMQHIGRMTTELTHCVSHLA